MPMEQVPGCIATVHLQVTLIPLDDDDNDDYDDYYNGGKRNSNPKCHQVQIDGTSDALLSCGLLSLF